MEDVFAGKIDIGDECEVYHVHGNKELIFMGNAIVVELPTKFNDMYTLVYTEPNSNIIRVGFVALAGREQIVKTGRRIKYEIVSIEKED